MVQRLEKFNLTECKGGSVELSRVDIKKSNKVCERSLVGRIYGRNGINFTGLKQTMSKLWCAEGELKVVELKNKVYQFIFSKAEERTRVLKRRPWSFDNQLLVIHPWQQDIENDVEVFLKSPLWIQAWQIPNHWLT